MRCNSIRFVQGKKNSGKPQTLHYVVGVREVAGKDKQSSGDDEAQKICGACF